jgi:translation initiation factor IF-3
LQTKANHVKEFIKDGDKVVSAGTNFIYAGQKLAVYTN